MAAGNIKCVDVNEDGVVDANDMAVIGDPNPDFTYGFQTRRRIFIGLFCDFCFIKMFHY